MHKEPLLQKVDSSVSLRFLIKRVEDFLFPKTQTLNSWKRIVLRTTSTTDALAFSDCSCNPCHPSLQPLPTPSSSCPGHRSTAWSLTLFPFKKAIPKAWGQECALEFGGGRGGWGLPPPLTHRVHNPNTAMLSVISPNVGPALTTALPPCWATCNPGPCLYPSHTAPFSNTPSCMLWVCQHLWEEGEGNPFTP